MRASQATDEVNEVSTVSFDDWAVEADAGELPETSYRSFNPRRIGIYFERFQALASALAEIDDRCLTEDRSSPADRQWVGGGPL